MLHFSSPVHDLCFRQGTSLLFTSPAYVDLNRCGSSMAIISDSSQKWQHDGSVSYNLLYDCRCRTNLVTVNLSFNVIQIEQNERHFSSRSLISLKEMAKMRS